MNADEVIESYVRDVAARLPRKTRNDVAFELRALLADELAAKAAAEGRGPDKAMAMAVLKAFGRPAEAARRYHEPSPVIDPADTHHFLIWALSGAVALGVLSALDSSHPAIGGYFLQWLGILVFFFALAAWWRRRSPDRFGWKPSRGPDHVPLWVALFSAAMTLVFPVFMYAAPQTFIHTVFLGAGPIGAFDLTDAFAESPQRTATLVMLVASAVVYALQGLRPAWVRWPGILVFAALGGLFVMHAAPMVSPDGGQPFEVFVSAQSNAVASPVFALIGATFILSTLYGLYREWARIRPAPSLKARAA